MIKGPLILCILDGYANNKSYPGNAIKLAKKPNLDKLFTEFSGIELVTWGNAVGLPKGQMGNSEVGHLNIGAGRIIYQSLSRVNKAIEDGSFKNLKGFKDAFKHVIKNESVLHLMGLYSPGGVHSSKEHFHELIKMAENTRIKRIHLHLILDGRDVPPMSASKDVQELLQILKPLKKVKIATISGRYYAMDRDRRWKRTNLAYDCMTLHQGVEFKDPVKFIEDSYKKNIGDEFVVPGFNPMLDPINDNSAIIFINFRPDRAIQICSSFTNKDYKNQVKKRIKNLFFVTMTDYGETVKPNSIIFPLLKYKNLFGKIIEENNLKQLRIAETEKYAHVTFFFDGGEHLDYKNEKKMLIHSPKVATYDLQPSMSAYEITKYLLKEMGNFDVVILNFANCDMVGHTGSIKACIEAVEAVDECVGDIYNKCKELGGLMIITADHGNADEMLDAEGNIVTKHSLNPVPFYILQKNVKYTCKMGKLADIAPTMLSLLNIDIPKEMTGDVLLHKARK